MNILIVEDEKHTAALLQEILEQQEDMLVTRIEGSIVGAVDYLAKYQSKIDLIFMDIQLNDGHSFEIFKNVDVEVTVIFCTSFDQFGLDAIQNNGIDYVLKPFEDDRIHQAVGKYRKTTERIKKKFMFDIPFSKSENPSYQNHFLGQKKEKSIVIPVDDIALFALEFETVYVYTTKNEKLPIYKTMDYIEQVLDPSEFYRINRQMILAKKAVKEIEPYFNRKIVINTVVNSADRPVVSRLKVTEFKNWLEGTFSSS